MKTLIIDTTSAKTYTILSRDGVITDCENLQGFEHSCMINVAINNLLARNNLTLAGIDIFALCVGPGSFTGIRVGIATVKGFLTVFSDKKVVAVNSLQTLAYTKKGLVNCLQDAGKGLFYYACYNGAEEIIPPTLLDGTKAQEYIDNGALVFSGTVDLTQQLNDLVQDKITRGQYVDKLSPIYIRKPQAEEERLSKTTNKTND